MWLLLVLHLLINFDLPLVLCYGNSSLFSLQLLSIIFTVEIEMTPSPSWILICFCIAGVFSRKLINPPLSTPQKVWPLIQLPQQAAAISPADTNSKSGKHSEIIRNWMLHIPPSNCRQSCDHIEHLVCIWIIRIKVYLVSQAQSGFYPDRCASLACPWHCALLS